MSENKKPSGNKNGIIDAAVIPLAVYAGKKLVDVVAAHDSPELISMPQLCNKNFPLDYDAARELIEACGLKAVPSKVLSKDVNVRFKDCDENQVIASTPRSGTKVKPGTNVYIKYVTKEIIEASRQKYSELEQQKQLNKEQAKIKKTERKEKTKENISNITNKAKDGVGKLFKKNKVEKLEGDSVDE